MIRRARHRLLIHSTFVSASRFAALLPDFRKAVALGVKVDILWGQDKNTDQRRSTAKVVQHLRAEIVYFGAIERRLYLLRRRATFRTRTLSRMRAQLSVPTRLAFARLPPLYKLKLRSRRGRAWVYRC